MFSFRILNPRWNKDVINVQNKTEMDFTPKFWIGVILELTAFVSLAWCLLVLVAVYKLAFVIRRSPVYIISVVNIVADSLTLANFVFYLCPCIMADSYILSEDRFNIIAIITSITATTSWFLISFSQILMAINRFVVICWPWIRFFNYNCVLLIVAGIIPLSISLSLYVQFLSPCCMFILDQKRLALSYVFIDGIPNYSNNFVHFPLNCVTSATAIFCYSTIFIYVRSVTSKIGNNQISGKRRHEFMYAIQFCAISGFHLLVWVSLRVFPLVIDGSTICNNNWFAFTTFCSVFSSLANSAVYSFFNDEVKSIILNRNTSSSAVNIAHGGTSVSPYHR